MRMPRNTPVPAAWDKPPNPRAVTYGVDMAVDEAQMAECGYSRSDFAYNPIAARAVRLPSGGRSFG